MPNEAIARNQSNDLISLRNSVRGTNASRFGLVGLANHGVIYYLVYLCLNLLLVFFDFRLTIIVSYQFHVFR